MEDEIEQAIDYGYGIQGAFMDDELAAMLKNPEVEKAFYEEIDECASCGRLWPIESMEDLPDDNDRGIDGLVCHYCVDN